MKVTVIVTVIVTDKSTSVQMFLSGRILAHESARSVGDPKMRSIIPSTGNRHDKLLHVFPRLWSNSSLPGSADRHGRDTLKYGVLRTPYGRVEKRKERHVPSLIAQLEH